MLGRLCARSQCFQSGVYAVRICIAHTHDNDEDENQFRLAKGETKKFTFARKYVGDKEL